MITWREHLWASEQRALEGDVPASSAAPGFQLFKRGNRGDSGASFDLHCESVLYNGPDRSWSMVVMVIEVLMVVVVTWTRISAWQRASSPGAELPPRSLQLEGGTTLWILWILWIILWSIWHHPVTSFQCQQCGLWRVRLVELIKRRLRAILRRRITFREVRRSRAGWGRGGRGSCWSPPSHCNASSFSLKYE